LHMVFPIGFKVQKRCSDTKRTKRFWVRKERSESIQYKQNVLTEREAMSQEQSTKQRGGMREGSGMMVGDWKTKRKNWLSWYPGRGNRDHKVGSLTLYCLNLCPASFGRSPEDGLSAVRARSGNLGSKASGDTLRGNTGRG